MTVQCVGLRYQGDEINLYIPKLRMQIEMPLPKRHVSKDSTLNVLYVYERSMRERRRDETREEQKMPGRQKLSSDAVCKWRQLHFRLSSHNTSRDHYKLLSQECCGIMLRCDVTSSFLGSIRVEDMVRW